MITDRNLRIRIRTLRTLRIIGMWCYRRSDDLNDEGAAHGLGEVNETDMIEMGTMFVKLA